jgi:hypothetical protein
MKYVPLYDGNENVGSVPHHDLASASVIYENEVPPIKNVMETGGILE